MASEPGDGMSTRALLLELRDEVRVLAGEVRDNRHALRGDVRALELRIVEMEAWRRDTDRRIEDAEDKLEDYGAVKERLSNIGSDVGELKVGFQDMRSALIRSALGVAASFGVFAFTIYQVFG